MKRPLIDPDIAYLLGMVVARGTFVSGRGARDLIIALDFRNLEAQGVTTTVNVHDAITLAVAKVRDRLEEVLGESVACPSTTRSVRIKVRFRRPTIAWRVLRHLTGNRQSYKEFLVPPSLYSSDTSAQEEFIRGVADACGFIRPSNHYFGQHRVYFQVPNQNWLVPVQLCRLLQEKLRVPVQTIQWGHPNTREPRKVQVSTNYTGWAREHQIKIFAHDYLRAGFGFGYKQEILQELAAENAACGGLPTKLCNPLQKKRYRAKPPHPCEAAKILPPKLRGRHFNSFWEICRCLGCKQGVADPQGKLFPGGGQP